MISLFNWKIYKGGFDNAEAAANYYDILSVNVFGLKVRPNLWLGKNK